jgi:hypothetical protein
LQTARIAAEFTMKNRKKTPEITMVRWSKISHESTEEEVGQIRESIGENTMAGFYAYGEMAPLMIVLVKAS